MAERLTPHRTATTRAQRMDAANRRRYGHENHMLRRKFRIARAPRRPRTPPGAARGGRAYNPPRPVGQAVLPGLLGWATFSESRSDARSASATRVQQLARPAPPAEDGRIPLAAEAPRGPRPALLLARTAARRVAAGPL